MSLITPEKLRELRNALGLTAEQAAASIEVKERTWQSYEAPIGHSSHRTMKVMNLQRFCERHKIPYPPVSNDGRLLVNGCKVISITTSKGGVGKSPITVNVATELARRGSKVAIVTSDIVFRCCVKLEIKRTGRFDHVGRLVHYYAEDQVALYKAEVHDLQRQLSDDIAKSHLTDPDEINSRFRYQIEVVRKKKIAPYAMVNLVSEYDYIFLDINHELYKTLLLSNLIVVVLNNGCMMSVRTAARFCEELERLNGGEPVLNIYGLLTNHAPGGDGSEFLRYIDEDEEEAEMRRSVIEGYQYQSEVYSEARGLGIPLLRTYMSKSHAMETEKYNSQREFEEAYGYFDSLIDIAPDSVASHEIRGLADELLDCMVRDSYQR
ncbi:AAA family ATPase [Pseudomonas shirazica]|uniref:AAA family ATPase n=1 Tax=Pseudomonas shirazica TaxID=1940636 RepID=UPI001EDF22EB|nr:AAA family ATPase [Pseudomonas shirazica]